MNFIDKRYYGKVFGGLLGFLLMRHPLGLMIGALFGHAFDAGWLRRKPPQTQLDEAYRVLNVSSGISDAELDSTYRRLMSKYHPDRVADAADDIRAVAEERARAINVAYDRIKQARREASSQRRS